MLRYATEQVWTCFCERFAVSESYILIECAPSRPLNLGASEVPLWRQNAQAAGTAWCPWRISSTLRRVAGFVSGSCHDPELIIRQQDETRILVWLPVTVYHFQLWSFFVTVAYWRNVLPGIPLGCKLVQCLCSDKNHEICQILCSGNVETMKLPTVVQDCSSTSYLYGSNFCCLVEK